MSFDITKWYNGLLNRKVLLKHKGDMSSELITELLDTIEEKFEETGVEPKQRKKLYNILVEALQNLFHHSSKLTNKTKPHLNDTVFVVYKTKDNFILETGNYVEEKKVSFLRDRLNQINHLNKDELKALYKLILNNEEFSEKGGGGLGMIDIARKSGNQLIGEFHPVNKNFQYFCFKVKV